MALANLSASTADDEFALRHSKKHHTVRHEYYPRPGNDSNK
jgi:hypothetical protein